MKKLFGIVLIIVLSTSVLAGCGKDDTTNETNTAAAAEDSVTNEGTENTTSPVGAAVAADTVIEVAPAVDLADYPVIWCRETDLFPDTYLIILTSETYERTSVIGTQWYGYRLIDDTHAEYFTRYRFNDDIDTSIIVTSQYENIDDFKSQYKSSDFVNIVRINDREEEVIWYTYTYEINDTEFIITNEQTSKTSTLHFTADLTSIVEEYNCNYLTDF